VKAHRRHLLGLASVIAIAAVGFTACGDDDDDGDSSATASAGEPVATQSIDGTDVLVDADGRALYTSDQEQDGDVVCTTGCLEIWDPVLVSELAGASPTDLGPDFGTLERPDGGRQLTLSGTPLYSFTEEGPGELTGDGLVDSFDGTEFTWTAATSGEVATSDDSESTDDSESGAPDGGGYGGY
jgi:predicted lipoprotein with Yx(FWY)xxD motif